jgi:hypothetical protein
MLHVKKILSYACLGTEALRFAVPVLDSSWVDIAQL